MADAMLSQINLLAQTAMLILPQLYGPNGVKDVVRADGSVDASVPPALLHALTQLETASVDPSTLTGAQGIDSVERQTLGDLQSLCRTIRQDIGIARHSALDNRAAQALAFDNWAAETAAIERDALQFTPAAARPPVTIVQPPPAPADGSEQFLVTDTTTGVSQWVTGVRYSGPVAGVSHELALDGTDSLDIQATKPNSFIHGGAGHHSISVAMVGAGSGTNVLDGGGGSNFLTGTPYGATDLFYLDARGLTASVASTIVNFHQGDQATVWGVGSAGFQMVMADNEGAPGFTGLTIGFTGGNGLTANVTLTGYSQADLGNGHLSLRFGHNPEEPGVDFVTITANANAYPAVAP